MNEEIKNEWVAALTSGEYEQGKSELRTVDNRYCCLGVLCNIAAKHGVGKWSTGRLFQPTNEQIEKGEVNEFDSSFGALPKFVKEWAGLESNDPRVEYTYPNGTSNTRALSSLNDKTDIGFAGIAELIKEQL